MEDTFRTILDVFGLDPEVYGIHPLGRGHIHDTYIVSGGASHSDQFLLQRINTKVFRDVRLLMRNLDIITNHIAEKNRQAGKDPEKYGIVFLETRQKNNWFGDEELGYWRICWFIKDLQSYEEAVSSEMAFEGGRAISEFQSMLADLNPGLIGDTIPRFHDLRMRIDQFEESRSGAHPEKKLAAGKWMEVARKYAGQFLEMYEHPVHADIPVRLMHHDTKFNNILFNKEGKATCLIDLDTVMQGYFWSDYGDGLRTCASAAPEDEPDEDKIGFNIDIFEGFTRGYIEKAKHFLTDDEMKLLHLTPQLFAYMQGVRFITDFLNNDVYYKTAYPEHNLIRARTQFILMQRMIEKQDETEAIILNALNEI